MFRTRSSGRWEGVNVRGDAVVGRELGDDK
jgi:hypothetical protein